MCGGGGGGGGGHDACKPQLYVFMRDHSSGEQTNKGWLRLFRGGRCLFGFFFKVSQSLLAYINCIYIYI